MTNSEKIKELINSLDITKLQTVLESTIKSKNFDFDTKVEWNDNKASIYVEENSEGMNYKLNVIEFQLN